MRIIFVRHGEPDYTNDCLTAAGKIQAQRAALRLREEGIGEIWSSPLGRAAETAQTAAGLLRLPVRTLDFMREVRWGSTNGKPLLANGHPWDIVNEMSRQGIDLTRPDWRSSPYFRTNSVTEYVDNVEKGIDEWLAGFGYVREGTGYRHLIEEKEHRTVALFSHGGSSSAAIGHILNLPFPYVCAVLHLRFTGITILKLDRSSGLGTHPSLELSNDAEHIREIG